MSERPALSVVTVVAGNESETVELDRTLASLAAQTSDAWEWVVLTPQPLNWRPRSARVRLAIEPGLSMGSEALAINARLAVAKAFAVVEAGTVLAPDAVEQLCATLDESEGEGMVYAAEPGLEPLPHNVAQPPLALGSLSAVSLDTYWDVSGFTGVPDAPAGPRLAQVDLACRIFQASGLRRVARQLTENRLDKSVDDRQAAQLYSRYLYANAVAWAGRSGLSAIDLTPPSGASAPEGLEPVAFEAGPQARIERPDSSVGVIRAVDVLAWFPEPETVLAEFLRVAAHGAVIVISTVAGPVDGVAHPWDAAFLRRLGPVQESGSGLFLGYVEEVYPSAWHQERRIPYVKAALVAAKDGPVLAGLVERAQAEP